jgi:ferredoxin
MLRPNTIRIDKVRCIHCELCYLIAPIIHGNPDYIPVTSDTLEAMAACPTGAIIWREGEEVSGEASDPLELGARWDAVD